MFSLALCGCGIYLCIDNISDSPDNPMQSAISQGLINTSSLVVTDKYQTNDKHRFSYVILSNGVLSSDIVRQIPKREYDSIKIGDNYVGYDFGSDYLIPAFDTAGMPVWKLYTAVGVFFLSFAFLLAARKLYKRAVTTDVRQIQFSSAVGGII